MKPAVALSGMIIFQIFMPSYDCQRTRNQQTYIVFEGTDEFGKRSLTIVSGIAHIFFESIKLNKRLKKYSIKTMTRAEHFDVRYNLKLQLLGFSVNKEMVGMTPIRDAVMIRFYNTKFMSNITSVILTVRESTETKVMYWADSALKIIGIVAIEEGVGEMDAIVDTSPDVSHCIVIHEEYNFLFWSISGDNPRIGRCTLAGKDQVVIVERRNITDEFHPDPLQPIPLQVVKRLNRIFWLETSLMSSDFHGGKMVAHGMTRKEGMLRMFIVHTNIAIFPTDSGLFHMYEFNEVSTLTYVTEFTLVKLSTMYSFSIASEDDVVVDPCLPSHICAQVCIAYSDKDYYCGCRSDHFLDTDGFTCTKDPCKQGTDRCQHLCLRKMDGNFTCECSKGFRLGEDGRACIDLNTNGAKMKVAADAGKPARAKRTTADKRKSTLTAGREEAGLETAGRTEAEEGKILVGTERRVKATGVMSGRQQNETSASSFNFPTKSRWMIGSVATLFLQSVSLLLIGCRRTW